LPATKYFSKPESDLSFENILVTPFRITKAFVAKLPSIIILFFYEKKKI